MALLTDIEIKEAIQNKKIEIEPFEEEKCLKGTSYDLRLGKCGIISKSVTLEQLRTKTEAEEVKEIDIETEASITIPGDAFALVNTRERIWLSPMHAGHIGMRSYYARKGLALLSGLQIDPGWDGHLVLGLTNLSPRNITLEYNDFLCTIEIHQLNREAGKIYQSPYMAEQREGRIPTADKDYLRTIETMSVTDLTKALIDLSSNIERIGKWVQRFWVCFVILLLIAILSLVIK